MQHRSRRSFLAASTAFAGAVYAPRFRVSAATQPQLVSLTPRVAYVKGDIEGRLTCNTGAIALRDSLVIVDAAIPSGSAAAFAAIRLWKNAPIGYVFNTHYHLDHSYGNHFWHAHGAQPIAYSGVAAELRKADPEMFGGKAGLYEKMTAKLPELRHSAPEAPRLYVASGSKLTDGSTDVVLLHPGVGHTHSDGIVWMPNDGVVFTGDLVVNGPYNAVADSTIDAWIATLDTVRALKPRIVVPGHGAAGGPELIENQQRYFRRVTQSVSAAVARGGSIEKQLPRIRAEVAADARVLPFINGHHLAYSGFFAFNDLVGKIYRERTGQTLAAERPAARCCGELDFS